MAPGNAFVSEAEPLNINSLGGDIGYSVANGSLRGKISSNEAVLLARAMTRKQARQLVYISIKYRV